MQKNNNSLSIAEGDIGVVKSNNMSIENIRLLVRVYWLNMNANIENIVKQCATCLTYQQIQPHGDNPI